MGNPDLDEQRHTKVFRRELEDWERTMRLLAMFIVFWVIGNPAFAITFDEARHLLARTGFGVAALEEIEALLPLTFEQSVDRIIDGVRTEPVVPLPVFQVKPGAGSRKRNMNAGERKLFQARVKRDRRGLKFWWIKEMLATDSPLTEHLVMFWHNHFVSESRKVKFGQMMAQQNAVFRKHALGNFREMLTEVSIGPAMLIYLDGRKNVKGKPNENFAREILELFTLGEGQGYTEEDVREAARAFTGWTIYRETGEFVFLLGRHDNLNKDFLGQSGNFDGIDILRIILKQPQVAEFITGKLWREFVSTKLDRAEIKRIAKLFRESDYKIRPLMKALLMAPKFRNPSNRGTLIKSPVELVIGTLRLLRMNAPPLKRVFRHQKRLGQDIFDPPDVKGWRGAGAWINSSTTLMRAQFVRTVSRSVYAAVKESESLAPVMVKLPFGGAEPFPLLRQEEAKPGSLERLLLPIKPVLSRSTRGRSKRLLRNLMLDPVYQLK